MRTKPRIETALVTWDPDGYEISADLAIEYEWVPRVQASPDCPAYGGHPFVNLVRCQSVTFYGGGRKITLTGRDLPDWLATSTVGAYEKATGEKAIDRICRDHAASIDE